MAVNDETHVPSEPERLLLILRHINTELRDAEKEQDEATRLDEQAHAYIVEETRASYARAHSTIARLERIKTLGTKNRQLLDDARSAKEEIERSRHEAFNHNTRLGQEKINNLRTAQKEARDALLALAEPDPKPK